MRKLTRINPFSFSSSPIQIQSSSVALIKTLTSLSSPTFSLKNVTKSNFEAALEDLIPQIRAADFVAVDLEMTGITSTPWRESFEFDRYDVRYLKVKDSAEKFAVVQFGVCPFRWDPLKLSFVAHPHNFYIFPRQELPADGPSNEFLCQTTSIDFLAQYQFDFNACIHEGVSYLSRGQEYKVLKRLNSVYSGKWHNMEEVRDVPLVNVADILFCERMKIRLNEWHDDILQNRKATPQLCGYAAESKQQFETIYFNMRPALRLNGFTSHQLKLIELVTRKHFADLNFVCAYDQDCILKKLVVFTESENDRSNLLKVVKDELHQHAKGKVKEAIGFRHVIDLLSAEKKLIVGHNCFLDMAHMYHKFFDPLPSTAEEFAANIHNSFPHIIDTKILLNADSGLQKLMKKASTSLASSFSQLCPGIASRKSSDLDVQPCVMVEVQVDDMRSSNWNSGAKHEAGYDAFMTGCVFAQACSHLGIDFPTKSVAQMEKLEEYINLLYLSWNSGDVINLSTGEARELPSINNIRRRFLKILYPNMVLIWGFPPNVNTREIRECVSKVFGIHSITSIYQLDETAVFIQFSKAELVADFLTLKERLEASNDSISVLHPLSKLLGGGKTCAAGYEFYKNICSSPTSKVLFAEQAESLGINWKTEGIEFKAEIEDPNQEQFFAGTTSSSYSSKINSDKLKKEIPKMTQNRSIFEKLYASGTEPNREMKVTDMYNS